MGLLSTIELCIDFFYLFKHSIHSQSRTIRVHTGDSMKLRILPLALVALSLPAMAQDRSFSLFYDKAPGTNGSITQTGSSLNLKPDDYSGLGLKFGVAVARWGP